MKQKDEKRDELLALLIELKNKLKDYFNISNPKLDNLIEVLKK